MYVNGSDPIKKEKFMMQTKGKSSSPKPPWTPQCGLFMTLVCSIVLGYFPNTALTTLVHLSAFPPHNTQFGEWMGLYLSEDYKDDVCTFKMTI